MANSPTKKYYLETFGCQMNFHDSEKVAGSLVAEGYTPVEAMEQADLILFNTCSIRDKAAQKVFHRLANFKALQRQGKRFGVLGCVAQHEGEEIFKKAPHVSLVVGSASYVRLPELLRELESGNDRVTGLGAASDETFDTEFTRRDNPHRAYLTLIEGCDKHCAYCVVPFTRGRERSKPSTAVLAQAQQLAAAGYTEVQLLGQNVNSYRDPTPPNLTFAHLLAAMAQVPGLKRVRYTTSHPRDFDDDIVRVMGEYPVLCDHVHLPVQSGSDHVLHLMRREYTRDQYLRKVEVIKGCRRPLDITTDLIVGFPGETDRDFEQTVDLLSTVHYSGVFIFKYSPRPLTAAITMPDSVPEGVKAERFAILQQRQQALQAEDNQAWVGRTVEVMIEGQNPKLGQWVGRSSQNRVVNFTSSGLRPNVATELAVLEPLAAGMYVPVHISKAGSNSFVGEQVAAVS